jgi:imidazole glycerol-phosphate synthase subunit HisF
VDVRRDDKGKSEVYSHCGSRGTGREALAFAREMETEGCGEILLSSIDRDGRGKGYDLDLVRRVATAVRVPVIALGGAGSVKDLTQAVETGHADAVAAGSLFTFHGRRRAVLISYLTQEEKRALCRKPLGRAA